MSGLSDLPPLREVIARHGLAASKALGQNFLLDPQLLDRIARVAGDLAGQRVYEVGPGPGGLTRALLRAGAEVVAVERDRRCLPALAELAEAADGRLRVIEGDAMAIDAAAEAGDGAHIVANLPSKFMPAIMNVLSEHLGGDDAKSKKSIAGEARRYRDASMSGVDTQALLNDLMPVMASNPAFANAFMGSKQGARMMASLGNKDEFLHKLDELRNHSGGFSKTVSDARMAGFDGAVSRFQNSIKNLETAVGRAVDNNGKGGFLTQATNAAGSTIQALAEANAGTIQKLLLAGGAGLGYAGFKGAQGLMGGFGLNHSAASLEGAAASLKGAAATMRGGLGGAPGGGLPGAPGSPGFNKLGGRAFMLALSTLLNMEDVDIDQVNKNKEGVEGKARKAADAVRRHMPPWMRKIFTFSDDADTRGRSTIIDGDGAAAAAAGGAKLFPAPKTPFGTLSREPVGPLTEEQSQTESALRNHANRNQMLGKAMGDFYAAERAKRPVFSNVPMPPARPQGLGSSAPQKVEVSGKAEVTSHSDVKVAVSISAPQGISATVTNTTTTTKPGPAISMPLAKGGGGKIDGYL